MNKSDTKTMLSKCLCEQVEYEIIGKLSHFYQCHCSQCRQVTGSASNTGVFVQESEFRWLKGEQHVKSYIKSSGYHSCFCENCGSALPNPMKNGRGYWVPAGGMPVGEGVKVGAHLHVDSKACWDVIGDDGVQFLAMPEFHQLVDAIKRP